MNLFCKMIIGCNPEMMDFIMHGLWHCVIGVGKDSGVIRVDKDSGVIRVDKDSGVIRVDKDSGHGTWLSFISSHGM